VNLYVVRAPAIISYSEFGASAATPILYVRDFGWGYGKERNPYRPCPWNHEMTLRYRVPVHFVDPSYVTTFVPFIGLNKSWGDDVPLY
jgi:hypothetical protein